MTVLECTYKGECYSVRDNGEVMRHARPGGRSRANDNQWTFGKVGTNGYLVIGAAVVHRIVAMAFLGDAPSDKHIVDHIDTNRQNNRSENLRWVTRLENILLNPITARRIAIRCGSVEAFLANPSMFRDKFDDPNFSWMSQVSKQEAEYSLARLLEWAKSDRPLSSGSLDQWIFNRGLDSYQETVVWEEPIVQSLTQNAIQRKWSVPCSFPSCPSVFDGDPIAAYAGELKAGGLFCTNDLYYSKVSQFALSDSRKSIYVMTESDEHAIKPWALCEISFEDGVFVHTSKGTFFEQVGAEKQFCLIQGLEWAGGESIDDYC